MKILKNENGFTLIEVLTSTFILSILIISSLIFFENYKLMSYELGEYDTAKNLGISVTEHQIDLTKSGNDATGNVFHEFIGVNGKLFTINVIKENIGEEVRAFSYPISLYKITTTVTWEDKKMEVFAYVSER